MKKKSFLPEMTVSTFLSVASLVVLFGYISYKEGMKHAAASTPALSSISDEGVIQPASFTEDVRPFLAVSYAVPNDIKFADESVPLEIPDVKERLDKELQINCYYHSNTIFLIKRAARWLPQMEEILKKNKIPSDFKYLPLIESNLLNVTSPRDAVGFWQILETSGKEFGLEISKDVDERYDPLKATEAACKYLNQAYRKFGNWALVAASYNRGMGGVERAIENQKVDNYYDLYLNDETSRYVFRLLAIKEIIEHPAKYGFKVDRDHLYLEEPLRYVEVNDDIKNLIEFAKANGTNYKLLKRHNPWLREENLKVRKGKTYKIALPKE
jgi:membrane-bound lytic murein transglycosylase D